MMQDAEQFRRYLRKPVSVTFRVRDKTQDNMGEMLLDTLDLGSGGAFLRSDLLLEPGDELVVTFALPEAQSNIQTKARVAWVTQDRGPYGVAGMGLAFTDLTREARLAIDGFVRSQSG